MVEEKKKCCVCKLELPLSDFYKCKSHKDGLGSDCKKCNRARQRKWYNENRKKANAYRKKHYRDNIEKYKEYSKNWSIKHKDKCGEAHKRWKANHPERVKAVRTRYENRRRAWERNTESRATTEQINQLIKDSDNICFWCDREIPNGKMHLDHIYPLSRGGKDEINNLVVSCEYCNKRKANKPPEEWLNEVVLQK